MALSSSVLSAALRARLLADPDIQARDSESLTAYCDAIAAVVVEHIIASAVVTVAPGIAVATTGTAVAQTGATTAPGTGSIS